MKAVEGLRRLGVAGLAAIAIFGLMAVASTARADGTPDIELDKAADPEVLYGEQSTVTLTASNPAGQPTGYNLSFRDVLPAGVSYVPGSAPASVGEPRIVANAPAAGQTTLIWLNVADLTPNSDFGFEFRVAHSQAQLSVGDTYTNDAGAYINCDPRYVPDFDGQGQPVQSGGDPDCSGANPDQSYTGFATDSAQTEINAIELTKDEPSPEGEILRGVHDHQTVYTLEVRNNFVNPTSGLTVEDYLPAGLEFLGCGAVDNTTDAPTNPGSDEEYAGSGPINPGNEPGGGWQADCVEPATVETVVDPAGLPAGVYTHVVWQGLPTIAPTDTLTLRYAAAIPIRQNTLDWNGAAAGNGTAPGTGGAQIANLDNNAGPETQDEQGLTNYALAAADYQGPDGPVEVSDEADLTRTAEDIRILKSVEPETLGIGVISEWTLQIDVGEYRYVDDIVVTDTLGDGYCPLGAANFEATPPAAEAECDPVGGEAPSAPYTSVAEQSDGTWEIVWDSSTDPALSRIQPSSSHTITFPTRTRADYQEGFTDQSPVLARDVAVNDVALTGDDFIVCAPGAPDACAVGSPEKIDADEPDGTEDVDVSDARQEGIAPSIDKRVSPTVNGDCSALGDYVDGPAPQARPGDEVCWRLTMTFPPNLNSGDVTVTDFIPPGTTYVAGSTQPTANNSATIASGSAPEPDVDGERLDWPLDDGTNTVDQGQVFEVTFAVRVQRNLTSSDGDIVDNLMKAVFENTAEETFPLRDAASFQLSQPEIDLVKGVLDIDGAPAGGRGPNVDGGTVTGGDVVSYRVDVTNDGSVDAEATQVWDVLPAQIACADVSSISNGGTCNPAEDRIEWAGLTVPAQDSITLTYDVTVPDGLAPGETLVNEAGVRQFQSASGSGPYTTVPASNIDPTQDPSANAPAADDPSNVQVQGVGVVKTRATEVTQPGNAGPDQATIGEEVDYTVTATIPAGTTLYGANTALVDDLGARKTLVPGSASATLDAGDGTPVPLPTAGLALSEVGNVVRIDFPEPYDNPQGSGADVIVLTFTAKVDDDFPDNQARGTSAQYTLPNTATLGWQEEDGTTRTQSGSVNTTIVEPDVSITKASDASGLLTPGKVVRFTVTGSNGTGPRTSTANDALVIDALPVGLDPVNGGVPVPDGGTVNPDGGVWNEALRTITWPATTLAPGANQAFEYDARVSESSIGAGTLINTATIVTTSLPDGADDDGERDSSGDAPGYEDGAELSGDLISGAISKSGSPDSATIGQRVTHTLTVTIPAGIGQYDTTVIDDLPDGLLFDSYVSATCTSGCTGGASDIDPVPLNDVAIGDGRRIGWFFGDLTAVPVPRTVELVYATNVADAYGGGGDVSAGDTLVNEADLLFNTADEITTPPTDPPDPADFDQQRETEDETEVVEPQVTLDKRVSGDPDGDDLRDTQPGDGYTYSIVVTNTGDAPAYDVEVTDEPDIELTNVQVATGGDWVVTKNWSAADRTIGWTIPGPIPAGGGSVTLTYTADLVPSANLSDGQDVDNTAAAPVYWGQPEDVREDPANEDVPYRDYDDVEPDSVELIVRVPDLALEKTTGAAGFPDDAPASIETPFDWRVVITNPNDPSQLNGVDLSDTLPPNWTYVPGSAQVSGTGTLTPGGQVEPQVTDDPAGDVLAWTDLGGLAGTQTIVVDFQATPDVAAALDPGVGAAHQNHAAAVGEDTSGATASAEGPYSDEDTATGTLAVPDADLAIEKTADDPAPIAGTDTAWTLRVTNNGPQAAPDVVVSDELPDGLTYVSAVPERGECAEDPAGTMACSLGAMAAGETVEIELTTTVGADQDGNVIENVATVGDPALDESDTTNNTSGDEVTPGSRADLSVAKELTTALLVGRPATYELTVANAGPSVARAARVLDSLPANLRPREARNPNGPCHVAAQTVDCELGDLAPGAVVTVQIDVDVLAGGATTNAASVSTETEDPNPSNDRDETTDPAGNADLAIDKTGPATLVEGKTRDYTLQVRNVGDLPSGGTVTVTDQVPDTLRPVSASGEGWACGIDGQLMTCTRNDALAPGQAFPPITLRVVARKGSGLNRVTNAATVHLTGDANPSNDSDQVRTPRGSQAEIDEMLVAEECRGGDLLLLPEFAFSGERTRVTVRVESKNGNAAAGVPVVLVGNGKDGASKRKLRGRTDRRGRATFAVHGTGPRAAWRASVAECGLRAKLPTRVQDTCEAFRISPRTIPVDRRTAVRVRLSAPDGSPLSGIWVGARGQGTGDGARTGRDGRVTLTLRPKGDGLIEVRARRATSCRTQIGAIGEADGSQLTG